MAMNSKGFFKNKRFKYGSFAVVLTAVVVAIIVLINAILGIESLRSRVTFDLTQNKLFSISKQSNDILKGLTKDVEIIIMAPENQYGNVLVTEVLKQYAVNSNGHIKTRFVDLDKDPRFITRELDPEKVSGIGAGDVVVKSGKQIAVLSDSDFIQTNYNEYGYEESSGIVVEQALTSAIRDVTADSKSKVYFVNGQGELSLAADLSDLKAAISMNVYDVDELSLTNAVPDDASVLVFAAPSKDLVGAEMENLMAYLEKGGNAIFLMNIQEDGTPFDNFNKVFNKYYLALNNDLVNENSQQNYLQETWVIRPMVYQNDVTSNLDSESLFVYLPMCRSITLMQSDKEWIKTQALFSTTENATSMDVSQKIQQGAFLLGALSEYTGSATSKIALVGNANFVTNQWMQQLGDSGKRYVVSMLKWMENKKDAIIIPAKTLDVPPLNLTEQSRIFVFILLAAIIPLLIIGLGVFIWIRRKNL